MTVRRTGRLLLLLLPLLLPLLLLVLLLLLNPLDDRVSRRLADLIGNLPY